MEKTHRFDEELGHMVQIVSAETLRNILDRNGEDYSRPKDFGDEDEWDAEIT